MHRTRLRTNSREGWRDPLRHERVSDDENGHASPYRQQDQPHGVPVNPVRQSTPLHAKAKLPRLAEPIRPQEARRQRHPTTTHHLIASHDTVDSCSNVRRTEKASTSRDDGRHPCTEAASVSIHQEPILARHTRIRSLPARLCQKPDRSRQGWCTASHRHSVSRPSPSMRRSYTGSIDVQIPTKHRIDGLR